MGYLLDVWGEGRIYADGNVTGFTDATNLNHKNQRISNGIDRGKSIPNLISVDDYENPKFPINDREYNYITLMGSPISRGTAREMCRVLNPDRGVIYLYDPSSDHNANFRSEASQFSVFFRKRVFIRDLGSPFNEIKLLQEDVFIYTWGKEHDEL
ncbi:hypothetical protein H6G74_28900 [Nostoc spongiaeforme FACHB-130]|uniref:Methyltransferase n=1 Tax=Nostoc spongiaeforme FACHB-130 TaxID=1357510 RepID=A0ABR8G5B3_9NOSO|nr:hypothetical protein [Nostoc spongiaeforme]MBD2598315.1 hypothetical protein [Nostoc spongiaeforme FACHB-130]